MAELLDRSGVLRSEEFSCRGQLISSGCFLLNSGQDHEVFVPSGSFFSEKLVKLSVQKR